MTEANTAQIPVENLQNRRLELDLIEVDPNQPRKEFGSDDLDRLQESLTRDGQWVPVLVYPVDEKFRLADGERRYRVAQKMGWDAIKAVVLPAKPDPATLLKMQIAVNCVRTDFCLQDRLATCTALKEQCGMSHDEIGRLLNVGKSTISRILSLRKLDDAEWAQVEQGELGLEAAYHLTKVKRDKRKEALDAVCKGKANRQQLRALAKKSHKTLSFVLGGVVTSFRAEAKLDVDELLNQVSELAKVLRKARRQGLDSTTLAKVLQDQALNEEVKS